MRGGKSIQNEVSTGTIFGKMPSTDRISKFKEKASFKNLNNFLWCEDCRKSYRRDCPEHGKFTRIKDKTIPSRAKLTAPYQLTIRVQELRAGNKHVYGVFARKIIQKRTQFGPYEGSLRDSWIHNRDDRLKLKLFHEDGHSDYFDCTEEDNCNWMMFVRPAQTPKEQNAIAFQYRGAIYFATTKVIEANTEMKIWYAQNYANAMGMELIKEPSVLVQSPPSPFNEENLVIDDEFLIPTPKKENKIKSIEFEDIIVNPTEKLETLADIALQPLSVNDINISTASEESAVLIQENSISGSKTLNDTFNASINASINDEGILVIDMPDISNTSDNDDVTETFSTNEDSVTIFVTPNPDNCNNESVDIADQSENNGALQAEIPKNKFCSSQLNEGQTQGRYNTRKRRIQRNTIKMKNSQLDCETVDSRNAKENHVSDNTKEDLFTKTSDNNVDIQDKNKRRRKPSSDTIRRVEQKFSRIVKFQKPRKKSSLKSKEKELDYISNKSNNKVKTLKNKGMKMENTNESTKINKAPLVESLLVKKRRNPVPKILYMCDMCDQAFNIQSKLLRHMQEHTGEKPFKCKYNGCGKSFYTEFKLKRHETTHGIGTKFKCPYCQRSFGRKDHLKNHLKVHDPNKQLFHCDECGKNYASPFAYKSHIALHKAEQGELTCHVCKEELKDKDTLLHHLKVHQGARSIKSESQKKHKCEYCEKLFFTVKDLRRHTIVHTRQRDFMCHLCPQRFGRKDHLIRHIKKAHGDLPKHDIESTIKENVSDNNSLKVVEKTAVSVPCIANPRIKVQQKIKSKSKRKKSFKSAVKNQTLLPSKIETPQIDKLSPNRVEPPPMQTQATLILSGNESDLNMVNVMNFQPGQVANDIKQNIISPAKIALNQNAENSVITQIINAVPPPNIVNTQEVLTASTSSQNLQLDGIPFVQLPQYINNASHNEVSNLIPDNLSAQLQISQLQNIGNTAGGLVAADNNNISISSLLNPVCTMSSDNSPASVSMTFVQSAGSNGQVQFSNAATGQHSGVGFNIPPAESPVFLEASLSDLTQLLNGDSKTYSTGAQLQTDSVKQTKKGKKQKSKVSSNFSLSKKATVKLKDQSSLQNIPELLQGNSNSVNTSVQSMKPVSSTSTNIHIPTFGSILNIDNSSLTSYFTDKVKGTVSNRQTSKRSVVPANPSLGTFPINPESFSLNTNVVDSQQQQPHIDNSSLPVAILSFNDNANLSTVNSEIQSNNETGIASVPNVQMLQLVNVNDLSNVNSHPNPILLTPENVTSSKETNDQFTQHNISQALQLNTNFKGQVVSSNQGGAQNIPYQFVSYDSEAVKIFFPEEQHQHN